MSPRPGCLKPVLLGCLSLLGVVVLITVITVLVTWQTVGKQDVVDREAASPVDLASGQPAAAEAPSLEPAAAGSRDLSIPAGPGLIVLDLNQCEFLLRPAREGEGVTVKARFDQSIHELRESFEALPDSTWVYRVGFRRTISGLQALALALTGRRGSAKIEVWLPPAHPLALDVTLRQGGAEIELGGLWLTEVAVSYDQGGMSIAVSEPLQEPAARFSLRGRMGGVTASRLGNASPRELDIGCAMGGADIDLRGAWRGDCWAQASVRMGGINLSVPAEMQVRDGAEAPPFAAPQAQELAAPTLWLKTAANMGEVEVQRR
ncbi:MAG: hypothetical protein RBT60_00675 [Candidatus Krumholzibacteria bacterium]|jgi:hypothetical protein|nr:hypothetical protein [Candidatus Krumholzibacteria bacterium]